ncbi:MAG: Cna B-type domain-containing protein, partial [Oscillospiraceae bacterium]
VTAEWIGGSAQARPTSATATLTSHPQTQHPPQILDEAGGWSCLWRDLPVKTEQGTEITYYVNETLMTDVTAEKKFLTALSDIWVPTDTLTAGEEFLIVQNRTLLVNDALAATTNPLYISAAGVTMGSAFTNGAERSGVTAASANCRWSAVPCVGTPGGFYLQNGTSYLCQNVDSYGSPATLGTGTAAQTVFTYTDQKYLRSDAGTYVMRNGSLFSATTDVMQATKLTLYRKVPADQSFHFVNNFQPKDPSVLGSVDYHKRIDYLGDGQGNPDTRRSGRDDYRLYLDVASGIQMPADLVLVLDASGSMDASRMNILSNALLGAEGFISRFLNADPKNQLSIVYFWGSSVNNRARGVNWATNNPLVGGNIHAGQDVGDATIYENWMTSAKLPYAPPLLKQGSGGTNYGAGLYWAQQLLGRRATSAATQYMVFMSDGVPTHGLSKNVVSDIAALAVEGTVFGRSYEAVPENLKNSASIYRYGTGGATPDDRYNEGFCKKANMVLARNFAASNPTLNIFPVGVDVTDPEVLQNLASGTGRYIRAENMADLNGAFASILGPTGVVISD